MNTKRLNPRILFPLAFLSSLIAFSVILSPVKAAIVQLKNDQKYPNDIFISWKPNDIAGSILTPLSDMYPVKIMSVDFTLFNGFPGAAGSATVRACIYSISQGKPSSQLGCSDPLVVTSFYPNWVSISLATNEIVIHSPDSFFAAVEYISGTQGAIPSIIMDGSLFIPEGLNYYSLNGGGSWIEHYDFWSPNPQEIGFNYIRATVETRYGLPSESYSYLPMVLRPQSPTITPSPTPTGEPCSIIRPGRWEGDANFTVPQEKDRVLNFSQEVDVPACGGKYSITADSLPIRNCKLEYEGVIGSVSIDGDGTFASETIDDGITRVFTGSTMCFDYWGSSWVSASALPYEKSGLRNEIHIEKIR